MPHNYQKAASFCLVAYLMLMMPFWITNAAAADNDPKNKKETKSEKESAATSGDRWADATKVSMTDPGRFADGETNTFTDGSFDIDNGSSASKPDARGAQVDLSPQTHTHRLRS